MARMPHTLGPFVAYHGCDLSVAEAVVQRRMALTPSINDYDWLGSGIYFWVDSAERGLDWAQSQTGRSRAIKTPCVIGALVYPGLCLNLTDYGVIVELQEAYAALERTATKNAMSMPTNSVMRGGVSLRRDLDCAVINMMHQARREAGFPAYDTVYGVFEEGGEIYPGSGFRKKTHVQIAVRNPACILGYFHVPSLMAKQAA